MTVLLDKNENPFDLEGELKTTILEKISNLSFNRYPDPEYKELKKKLGDLWELLPECVVLGNGGDEILWMVFSCFVRPGDAVLAFTPTFSEYYRLSNLFRARFVAVPIDLDKNEPVFNLSLFLRKLEEEKPALVLLDTPNNPTGKTLPSSFIEDVLANCESFTLVDEAYGEFAEETYLSTLRRSEVPAKAIILKTLSKAWGMAGIRLGYALCGDPAKKRLDMARSPFNLNILSQAVAETVLDHPASVLTATRSLQDIRDEFRKNVQNLPGWKVFQGAGNFLLVRSPVQEEVVRKAAGETFRFKYMDLTPENKDPHSWIRITVGKKQDMDAVAIFFSELGL